MDTSAGMELSATSATEPVTWSDGVMTACGTFSDVPAVTFGASVGAGTASLPCSSAKLFFRLARPSAVTPRKQSPAITPNTTATAAERSSFFRKLPSPPFFFRCIGCGSTCRRLHSSSK